MNYTTVKVPTITMDELTKLQNDYVFFADMLKTIERKKKKTPGNGFAKMKCKERMAASVSYTHLTLPTILLV